MGSSTHERQQPTSFCHTEAQGLTCVVPFLAGFCMVVAVLALNGILDGILVRYQL